MKKWIIKKLNGFTDIDDAINHIRNIQDADKKAEILSEAVKKLYSCIGPDDILRQDGGQWIFKGRPLQNIEVAQLREEAQALRTMKLWSVIRLDIKYQLGKKMFEEARCKDDLVWGQLTTFLNDIIQSRIKSL